MIKKVFILKIVLFFICIVVQAQKTQADRYMLELQEGVDTARINEILAYLPSLQQEDPKSALQLSRSLFQLVKKNQHPIQLFRTASILGRLYEGISAFDSAIFVYEVALEKAKAVNDHLKNAEFLTRIGVKYDLLFEWEKAIEYHLNAQRIYSDINDTIGIVRTEVNLYTVYNAMKDYTRAGRHIRQAYQLASITDNSEAKGYTSLNLAAYFEKINLADSSIIYTNYALANWEKLKRDDRIAQCLNNLGTQYVVKGEYRKGIDYIHKANGIKIRLKTNRDLANGYLSLGKAYNLSNQLDSAEFYYRKAIILADTVGIPDEYINGLKDFSVLLYKKGNIQEAWKYQQRYVVLSDSLFSDQRNKALAEAEVRHEVLKKGQQILLLEKEKQAKQRTIYFSLLLLVLSVGLLLATAYAYRNRKRYHLQIEKSQQLKLLLNQINPHFLFNTLNNLYSLTLTKSDIAPAMLLRLSALMRYMVESSKRNSVTLENEIDYLENYIALEKMRLPRESEIKFHRQGVMTDVMVPPMLFIPFIENGFKHGGNGIMYRLKMDIFVLRQGDEIFFEMENTKPILKTEKPISTKTGLSNIQSRLEMLYKGRYKLSIEDQETSYKVLLIIRLV